MEKSASMNLPFRILLVLAVILWISAFSMFVIGTWVPNLSILRLAAIPDALMAFLFTAVAAQNGSVDRSEHAVCDRRNVCAGCFTLVNSARIDDARCCEAAHR